MRTICRATVCVLLLLSLTSLSGCFGAAMQSAREAAQRAEMSNNLKMLGLVYISHYDEKQKSPAGWDELMQQASSMGSNEGLQAARDAGYQVQWDVDVSKVTIGTTNYVLAHHPNAGPTLYLDGKVMNLTPAELSKALKLRESE